MERPMKFCYLSKNIFIVSLFWNFFLYAENGDDRAPRLDAPPVTSPISVVVPSLDLGAVLRSLSRINCKIGNVNQDVCQDTILSVLGDACGILGISISEALAILIDCCDQTPTVEVTCTVDLTDVFTTLEHLVVTATVDLSEIFTVLQDIETTLTTCCDTLEQDFQFTWTILADLNDSMTCCAALEQDFQNTWTILAALNTLIIYDFNGTWTQLTDIKNTETTCCATLQQDFNNTWTVLAALNTLIINDFNGTWTQLTDIKNTETICCATLEQDFQNTWTILAALNTLIINDFNGTWTQLTDIKNTETICCATLEQDFQNTWTILAALNTLIINDFNGTWTQLTDIKNTETTCCATLEQDFQNTWTILAALNTLIINDFNGTWTQLTDIKNTETTCCATLIQDFNNTWTILADLKDTLTNCGMATAITQAMIPFTITEPGLYCLAEDVTVPGGGTGITINDVDRVILNLNDHQIIGGSIGIAITSTSISQETIVKDGIISGQTTAGISGNNNVFLAYTVENVVFHNILNAGILDSASYVSVVDCLFYAQTNGAGNGFSGTGTVGLIKNCQFFYGNDGIQISGAFSLAIEDCQIIFQLNRGIVISDGGVNITIQNVNIKSVTFGIELTASRVVIDSCTIENYFSNGILIHSGSDTIQILNSSILFALFDPAVAIQVDGITTQISNCSLNSYLTGISLTATSDSCEVINNILIGTGGVGTTGISNAGTNNRIYRNYATNNATNYSGVSPVNSPGGALSGNFNDFIANVSN